MNAQDRWSKENSVRITIRIMRRTEADILAKLEEHENNKSSYIKELIRKDIANEN